MTSASILTESELTQSRLWQEELTLVRGLRDALGMKVDPGIEEAVAALRLLGFQTTMSCAGHVDRATTGGPYIMFKSESAHAMYISTREELDPEVREATLRDCQIIALRDADRLRHIVERFSRSRSTSDNDQRLELRPVGHWGFRLCFVHADFSTLLSFREHKAEISARQSEMSLFTAYLMSPITPRG